MRSNVSYIIKSILGRNYQLHKNEFLEKNRPFLTVCTNGVGNLESALNSEEVQDHLQEYHENSEPIHQGLKQRREEKVNLKRTAAEDDPLMLERAEKECKVESYETLARYWQ